MATARPVITTPRFDLHHTQITLKSAYLPRLTADLSHPFFLLPFLFSTNYSFLLSYSRPPGGMSEQKKSFTLSEWNLLPTYGNHQRSVKLGNHAVLPESHFYKSPP